MSLRESPITSTDSRAGTLQREWTVPSSPMSESLENNKGNDGENKENGVEGENADGMDDLEGMDSKAKALMHLLKTSHVSAAYAQESQTESVKKANPSVASAGLCCYHVRQNEEAARRGEVGGRKTAAAAD